jgi:REP element-mobilizing transposase RayT
MVPRVYNLRSDRSFRVIERALFAAAQRDDARIVHFSVQGNHIHLLVEADDRRALSSAMRSLAIRIGLGMNRLMGSDGKVIAHRYHAHQLHSPTEVFRALGYVRGNHAHHARRLGRAVPTSTDRYSSDSVHVFAAPAAKTWLLSIGWQKSLAARATGLTRCDES